MAAAVAGDVCFVTAAWVPVRRGADAGAESVGFLGQNDVFTVLRTDQADAAAPSQVVCFEMEDGTEAWISLVSDDGGSACEVLPDEAEEIGRKILTTIKTADAAEEAEPQCPSSAEPEPEPDSNVDPGAELTRQGSAHGQGYDALLEQGVPSKYLQRAWVMSGGDMEGAMEFIRAK